MIIIFIAGASGSGKSELSKQLLARLHSLDITSLIMEIDNYYKIIPAGKDIEEYNRETNYDAPESIDLALLKEHIISLACGESIAKPLYDFKSGSRTGFETVYPPNVLIVEGIFALHFAKTYLPDTATKLNVFIETNSYLTIVKRRDIRNQKERGHKDNTVTLWKERKFVGPAFFFGGIASSKSGAHIIIDNSEDKSHKLNPLEFGVDKIVEKLEEIPQIVGQTPIINSL